MADDDRYMVDFDPLFADYNGRRVQAALRVLDPLWRHYTPDAERDAVIRAVRVVRAIDAIDLAPGVSTEGEPNE